MYASRPTIRRNTAPTTYTTGETKYERTSLATRVFTGIMRAHPCCPLSPQFLSHRNSGPSRRVGALCQPFFVPGQFEEHVFQGHGNQFEFDEPPVVGHSQPRNVFPDVFAQVAFE